MLSNREILITFISFLCSYHKISTESKLVVLENISKRFGISKSELQKLHKEINESLKRLYRIEK